METIARMLDLFRLYAARLKPARTIQQALCQLVSPAAVNDLAKCTSPEDLISRTAEEFGLDARELLAAVAERLRIASAE